MGLLTKKVELKIAPPYINYFRKRGYEFPMIDYGNGEYHVDISKTFEVDVNELPEGSGVKVVVQCDNPNCNDIHEVRYYNYLNMMKKYNGVYCRLCVIKLFHSGSNAYNWNGDKTDELKTEQRNDNQYRIFRRAVLKRDKHKCQCCGRTDDLDVHHKNGFSWCKEQRFNLDNGVTLCHSCHCDFHDKYGFGMNTEKQYNEWINNVDLSKISFKSKGNNLKNERKIYCYEEAIIYESINEFKQEKGFSKYDSSIKKACNHCLKDSHGYHLFWYDEYINLTDLEIQSYVSN